MYKLVETTRNMMVLFVHFFRKNGFFVVNGEAYEFIISVLLTSVNISEGTFFFPKAYFRGYMIKGRR